MAEDDSDNHITPPSPSFGKQDLTDGRAEGEWKTIYTDPSARRQIRWEQLYLSFLIFIYLLLMAALWCDFQRYIVDLPPHKANAFVKYGFAWLTGMLGGTVFAAKWLYHTVAKKRWHQDRFLWRLFTPHISAALAMAAIALMTSRFILVLDRELVNSNSFIVGVSFLVGYFSDNAIAKFAELAGRMFRIKRDHHKAESKLGQSDSRRTSDHSPDRE